MCFKMNVVVKNKLGTDVFESVFYVVMLPQSEYELMLLRLRLWTP